ncbi:MAG: twin-arginine translocation signal domain-containing protein [Faecalibacterium longum]|nr:twin-arginine translocation signal domain-containing protein [Faecalibacterium prausnitzii]MDY5548742.1 twin-arginine translocation signal domain-containing protein [Faecalibacterium longum]
MSLEFNRRSFLKYSAAAAVAVAGSSLLVGCGEDEYQKTGKIGSTLKLMGTFTMYGGDNAPTYSTADGFKCKLSIKCTTKKVPLYVTNECFELTVTRGTTEKNYAKQYITITDPEFDLKESEEAKDFTLTIKNVDIKAGDKVELKYWPRIQASSGNSGYTRAFCTWKMDAVADGSSIKLK